MWIPTESERSCDQTTPHRNRKHSQRPGVWKTSGFLAVTMHPDNWTMFSPHAKVCSLRCCDEIVADLDVVEDLCKGSSIYDYQNQDGMFLGGCYLLPATNGGSRVVGVCIRHQGTYWEWKSTWSFAFGSIMMLKGKGMWGNAGCRDMKVGKERQTVNPKIWCDNVWWNCLAFKNSRWNVPVRNTDTDTSRAKGDAMAWTGRFIPKVSQGRLLLERVVGQILKCK